LYADGTFLLVGRSTRLECLRASLSNFEHGQPRAKWSGPVAVDTMQMHMWSTSKVTGLRAN
jgi:hypothetical protein